MCALSDPGCFVLLGNASKNRGPIRIEGDHTTHELEWLAWCHRECESRIVCLVSNRTGPYATVLKRPTASVARSARLFAWSSDSATVDSGSLWPETKAGQASMSSASVSTFRAMLPCVRINGFSCHRRWPRCGTLHLKSLRQLSRHFVDEAACPFLGVERTSPVHAQMSPFEPKRTSECVRRSPIYDVALDLTRN